MNVKGCELPQSSNLSANCNRNIWPKKGLKLLINGKRPTSLYFPDMRKSDFTYVSTFSWRHRHENIDFTLTTYTQHTPSYLANPDAEEWRTSNKGEFLFYFF